MFQGAITVQSTSTIMAVGWFSSVKLLPLVDPSTPPYITGISDQDYLALRAGYSQAVGGGNFLLQLLETFFLFGGRVCPSIARRGRPVASGTPWSGPPAGAPGRRGAPLPATLPASPPGRCPSA